MLWILAGAAVLVFVMLLDVALMSGFVLRLFSKAPGGPEPPRLRGR